MLRGCLVGVSNDGIISREPNNNIDRRIVEQLRLKLLEICEVHTYICDAVDIYLFFNAMKTCFFNEDGMSIFSHNGLIPVWRLHITQQGM